MAERFLDSILHDARELQEMLTYKAPMLPLTEDEQVVFAAENVNCHIRKQVIKPDGLKCCDHCHLFGSNRGPSHQVCNLNNLKNYDAHILIAAAKKRHGRIKCIPATTEKYISFTIVDVGFKDFYTFTQSSLEDLVSDLETNQLINTRRWQEVNAHQYDLDFECDDEEDQPTEYDMSFIDDRPLDQLAQEAAPSKPWKRCLADPNDDDDNNIPRQR